MTETSVEKRNQNKAPEGEMGQNYLVSGEKVSMRLWQDEAPNGEPKPTTQRDYETIGYVLRGKAELHVDGEMKTLNPGDSWVVPEGMPHTYRILETFSAIEATSPPARFHQRDAVE